MQGKYFDTIYPKVEIFICESRKLVLNQVHHRNFKGSIREINIPVIRPIEKKINSPKNLFIKE